VDGFVRRDLPGCVVCPAACRAAACRPAVRPVRLVMPYAAPSLVLAPADREPCCRCLID